jgi:hypothetical protein
MGEQQLIYPTVFTPVTYFDSLTWYAEGQEWRELGQSWYPVLLPTEQNLLFKKNQALSFLKIL